MKIRILICLIAGLLMVLASVGAFAAPPFAGEAETGIGDQGAGAEGAVPLTFLASEVPLFAFLEDGKQARFAVEILHEIMRRLDVMLNIVKTREREEFIRFSGESYIETPRAIVVRKGDTGVKIFKDLYGKTVAV